MTIPETAATTPDDDRPIREIVVVTTGGTIAARTDAAGAVVADGDSHAVLAAVAEALPADASLRVVALPPKDSSALDLADVDGILAAVRGALADAAVAGVVVTHGTDTLEETAMALDLVHDDPRPVVVTGAQRAADAAHPDGPDNLRDAVRLAADPMARELGVLVAFGRAILQARGLRKWHTTDLVGFVRDAPDTGDAPAPADPDDERPTLAPAGPLAGVRVDVVACPPGADATAARACVEAGARGLVLEGMGSGNVPPAVGEYVAELAASRPDVVVVLSSRVPRGTVAGVYGGPGGGATLAALGALPAGHLRSGQARVLLAALLAGTPPTAGSAGSARERWERFSRVEG